MIINEPSFHSEELRREFNFLRGSVVSSFASCEFMMGTFLYAIHDDDRFAFKSEKIPYKVDKRINTMREVFQENKQLQFAQESIEILLNSFETIKPDRNAFAHGLARLDAANSKVEIRKFSPKPNDGWAQETKTYCLIELPNLVKIFDAIVREIIALILNLDHKFELGLNPENYSRNVIWKSSESKI